MGWTLAGSVPLDNFVVGACWASDREEFAAVGANGDYSRTFMRSADGITWEDIVTPFDLSAANGIIRDLLHGNYVNAGSSLDAADAILTSPDGDTWTGRGNPFVVGGYPKGVAVRQSDGAILIAGSLAGVSQTQPLSISTDDAATWDHPSFGVGVTAYGFDVAVRSDDLILLVALFSDGSSIAVSTDGGGTWSFSGSPFGTYPLPLHCAIRESDGALIVASGDANGAMIAISTDDGATWTQTATDPFATYDLGVFGFSLVREIAVREADGAIIAAGYFYSSDLGGYFPALSISTDDGATWTDRTPTGTSVHSSLLSGVAVRESDGAIIVCGDGDPSNYGHNTVGVSTNDGATWTWHTPDPGFQPIAAVAVRQSDDLILALGGAAFVSSNGGTSWTESTAISDSYVGAAVRVSDGLLVAAGSENTRFVQVALSSDDGATWGATDPAAITAAVGQGYCIGCDQDAGVVIVGSGAKQALAVAADGETFAAVSSPFDYGTVMGVAHSASEGRWMAAGVGSDFNGLVAYSDDDGATWTQIEDHPMPYPYGQAVYRDEVNGRWYLIGTTTTGKAIAYSDDNGATWVELDTPLGINAYGTAMLNVDDFLVLGGSDSDSVPRICVSSDGGNTWFLDTDANVMSGWLYCFAHSPSLERAVVGGY